MMCRNIEEYCRNVRLKRAMRVKIKRDEWMLQTYPYVYRSRITQEDKAFMKENFMCCFYTCAIVRRKYSVHAVIDTGVAFSGRYKGQAYYRKQWKKVTQGKRVTTVSN